jgi:RNase H-like domain found in reverse transcriptase
LDRCKFLEEEIEYLGHRIDKDGIFVNKTRREKMLKWKKPRTIKEMRQYFGYINFCREFIQNCAIVCDASLKGIGGILIQEEPKMKLLGCFSKTLGKHEKKYSTIEKELYSIVKCLENWRYILHGTRLPISVYSDYKNLLNYRKFKIRGQKHVMWWQILNEYNIEMKFIEGKEKRSS